MSINRIFVVLIFILTVLFSGCRSPITPFYWEEHENRFNTNDLARAQKEIPFSIIIPTYSPENNPREVFPDIEGPLSQFQDENNTEIIIKYGLDLGNNVLGAVMIYESNFASFIPESELKTYLELNPQLELIEIEGIPVIKTKDEFSAGFDAYYSFDSKVIYYHVETHNIPNEESFKIVESIIKQIK